MVVVITGASAGIGRALAEHMHARGAKLVLSARRLELLEALNQSLGGQHLVVTADVAKQEDCRRLIDVAIARFGRIDTLVCNAGYGIYFPVHQTSPQQMRDIFATNVFGTTDCIDAALPHLLKQPPRDGWRGQVVVVSSFVGRRAVPLMGAYSATKAAQLSIAEAMRVELRDQRIAVTSVHPIMTKTEFGQVAEAASPTKLPASNRDRFQQSVEHVVRRMIAAIERPQPEVWPSRPSRWLAGLGTLMPKLIDRGMAQYLQKVEAANRRTE